MLNVLAGVTGKVVERGAAYMLGEETLRKLVGDDDAIPAPSTPNLTPSIVTVVVGGVSHFTTLNTLMRVRESRLARWALKWIVGHTSSLTDDDDDTTPVIWTAGTRTLFVDREGE
ncbi:hypothetical protein HDU67_008872, partial [Dinochytrium kinnereticum]